MVCWVVKGACGGVRWVNTHNSFGRGRQEGMFGERISLTDSINIGKYVLWLIKIKMCVDKCIIL